jgi:hypothetical protein
VILGISVDDVASHKQFAEDPKGLSQMVLADLRVLEGKPGGS